MRQAQALLHTADEDVVAEPAERGRRRCARQTGADDDDRVLALVGGVDQLHLEFVPVPLLVDRSRGNSWIERHACTRPAWARYTHAAITMKPPAISTASTLPATSSLGVIFG